MTQSKITFNIFPYLPVLSYVLSYSHMNGLSAITITCALLNLFCFVTFIQVFFVPEITLSPCFTPDVFFYCRLNPGVIISGKPALIFWFDFLPLCFITKAHLQTNTPAIISLYYNHKCFLFFTCLILYLISSSACCELFERRMTYYSSVSCTQHSTCFMVDIQISLLNGGVIAQILVYCPYC